MSSSVASGADRGTSCSNIPLEKILSEARDAEKSGEVRPWLVLVACGSFNPPTVMHVRMFESARDQLEKVDGRFRVVGGLLSPVHDAYNKAHLVRAADRVAMCRAAVASSEWLDVAAWESEQVSWSRSATVLTAYARAVRAALGRHVEVRLLCGSDVLRSMADPRQWAPEFLEVVLGEFGVVALDRPDDPAAGTLHHSDTLYRHRARIDLVPQWIANNVSSTAVRRQVARGASIRYLVPEAVEEYIRKHKLYASIGPAATASSPSARSAPTTALSKM